MILNWLCKHSFYKWKHKDWMTAHLFTVWFTEYVKSIFETYCSEKKKGFLSKHYCSLTMHLGHPRTLTEMNNDINVLCKPANTHAWGFPGSWWRIHLLCRRSRFDSWVGKIHWRRDRLLTPWSLGFPGSSAGKESACNAGDLGWEDPLEKGMATHSCILAWRIPRTV